VSNLTRKSSGAFAVSFAGVRSLLLSIVFGGAGFTVADFVVADFVDAGFADVDVFFVVDEAVVVFFVVVVFDVSADCAPPAAIINITAAVTAVILFMAANSSIPGMKTLLTLLLLAPAALGQLRPVNTFSIVARDPATGQMGVAVQSHWFAVGQMVPWAEAGVGAIATQSFVDPTYGKVGLELLRAGRSAPAALRALLSGDASCEVRQVAILDASGDVATFTGSRDIPSAGSIAGNVKEGKSDVPCGAHGGSMSVGRDFAVQANLMSNDRIWPAMAEAYAAAKGDLADRMLAALDAAQAAGGDIRGKQSAAIIIVNAKSTGRAWQDRVFDLRVDDNPTPLVELRRLVALQRAYNHMNAGDLAVEQKDNETALREYSAAEGIAATTAGIPASRHAEMIYWHAVALVNMGRVDESLPLFQRAFAMEAGWKELTPRLARVGLLPDDAKLLERIVGGR